MSIYKFNELKLLEKPNIIKIIGPGNYNKHEITKKIIISLYDKQRINSKTNIIKFETSIFTYEHIYFFPQHIPEITQYFKKTNNFKDFYLLRKHNVKKNSTIPLHILLVDYNLSCRGTKDKYFQKLIDNYKKLNLIIIFYEYMLLLNYMEADYLFLINDHYKSNIKRIYDCLIDNEKMKYDKFKKVFKKITENEGIMIIKKDIKDKFYKLNELYDKIKEHNKKKMEDSNYDPLSDESNIIFF